MKPINKTKQELIDELEALRERVSELEKCEGNSRHALGNLREGIDRPFPQTTHMQEAIFVVFGRKLEFVNDGFAKLFGVSPEEACSTNFDPITLIAPESRRFIRELYREACRCAITTKLINYTGLSKDGLKIECETFLLFIPYKWGIAIQGTLRGISVRSRIEEALRQRQSDFPGVLKNVVPTGTLYAEKGQAQKLRDAKDEMPVWNLFNIFAHNHSPNVTPHF